jgi:hypothetical protein
MSDYIAFTTFDIVTVIPRKINFYCELKKPHLEPEV